MDADGAPGLECTFLAELRSICFHDRAGLVYQLLASERGLPFAFMPWPGLLFTCDCAVHWTF